MSRVYDLVMTHKLDADDFFIHRVQAECARHRLNFFLVEPLWAERFLELLQQGRLRARTLLNMHSEHHDPNDLYHRLVQHAAQLGTRVIDPPHVARAAFDKAGLHPRLAAAGIPTPPSVIVPRSQVTAFQLTSAHREMLGMPFVVKPALGYGRRGVLLNAMSEADLVRSAAEWPGGDLLLQRRIQARVQDGEPAYFRVYHVFGEVWPAWWNCHTDRYRLVTPPEHQEYGLDRAEALSRQIAQLTGMRFFSTEFAQVESGEFVAIDYVNDQCHMLSQSANPDIGVPDELVARVARRLVAGACELMSNN